MLFDGFYADEQFVADLDIRQASNHQRHDFPFALGQRVVGRAITDEMLGAGGDGLSRNA